MKIIVASLLLAIASACSQPSNAGAPKADPAHNAAVETVKYAESGATCEPAITTDGMHAARCTLPNGAKIDPLRPRGKRMWIRARVVLRSVGASARGGEGCTDAVAAVHEAAIASDRSDQAVVSGRRARLTS